jgi:hypothetical protein
MFGDSPACLSHLTHLLLDGQSGCSLTVDEVNLLLRWCPSSVWREGTAAEVRCPGLPAWSLELSSTFWGPWLVTHCLHLHPPSCSPMCTSISTLGPRQGCPPPSTSEVFSQQALVLSHTPGPCLYFWPFPCSCLGLAPDQSSGGVTAQE